MMRRRALVPGRAVALAIVALLLTLLAAQAVGAITLNPLWGWWGDRRGKLSLLKLLALVSAVSPIVAIAVGGVATLSPAVTLAAYVLVFFFAGAATSGEIIGDLGYLMEISPDDRRAEYSGYMNALVAPSRLLPLAAGLLVSAVSFEFVFAVAAVAAVLGRLAILARPERSR